MAKGTRDVAAAHHLSQRYRSCLYPSQGRLGQKTPQRRADIAARSVGPNPCGHREDREMSWGTARRRARLPG